MGSFIMINTDDLDSLKVALNTRVHGMCETAPIDAGERLMNVIDKFTSGGMDTSDEKATLPIDSVNRCALQQIEKVMIEASKCKATFCMKYVDNEGFTVPIEITENRTDNILGDISVETIRIDIEHCG